MEWEKNIFGLIPESEWLNIGFRVTRPNDPIDGLIGDEKTDNLMARWQTIAAEYQIPVMAQFHGFDTQARTTFRVPVDTQNIEKGLIKVKINQSERLRELMRSGVRNDEMFDYVMNDGVRLADQVFTRSKVAKNEMLATGKVTIKENDLDLTVDYGVPAANIAYTINTATDDIPAKIQQIVDDATAKGVVLNGILTSKQNLTKIRASASVQTVINGASAVGATVRNADLRDWMSEEFGINQIVTNDLTYGASAVIGSNGRPVVTTKRYYPANKITFFATNPAGRLGVGLWGNPPEVDAANFMKVNSSSVSPYVYVSQWMENDPAVLWTKASGLYMPVLYNPDSLYIATVS